MNDHDERSGLHDLGFSLVTGLIIIAFAAVMYWGVPPFARWVML